MQRVKKGLSAYDTALYYLTPKARTVREMENYLDEGNYSEIEIMNAVERLIENGLLNDEKYAKDFVESRLNTKPVSKSKLKQQLEGHFIAEEIIKDVLNDIEDDVESKNAQLVAEKYFRQFASLESSERLRRVGLRLTARGYSVDCVKKTLAELKENMIAED